MIIYSSCINSAERHRFHILWPPNTQACYKNIITCKWEISVLYQIMYAGCMHCLTNCIISVSIPGFWFCYWFIGQNATSLTYYKIKFHFSNISVAFLVAFVYCHAGHAGWVPLLWLELLTRWTASFPGFLPSLFYGFPKRSKYSETFTWKQFLKYFKRENLYFFSK